MTWRREYRLWHKPDLGGGGTPAAALINCDTVGTSFFPRVSASICKMDVTPTFESWLWKLEIKDKP